MIVTNHVDDKDGILEKIMFTVSRAGSSHMAVSWGGGGGGEEAVSAMGGSLMLLLVSRPLSLTELGSKGEYVLHA